MHGFCVNSEPIINYRQVLQKRKNIKHAWLIREQSPKKVQRLLSAFFFISCWIFKQSPESPLCFQIEAPYVLNQQWAGALVAHVRDMYMNHLKDGFNCGCWWLVSIMKNPIVPFIPEKVYCGRENKTSNHMRDVVLLCICCEGPM
jgi:hypothetical protein